MRTYTIPGGGPPRAGTEARRSPAPAAPTMGGGPPRAGTEARPYGVLACSGRRLGVATLALAAVLAACNPDDTLRALNLGSTAIVTGDFDTVEQLIQEVANTQNVQATITMYDGYIDGPHFETETTAGADDLQAQVEDLLRAETHEGLDQYKTSFFSCGMRGVNQVVYNGVSEDDYLVRDGTVVEHVRAAVEHGARMYFSDWTYDLLEATWPDQIDWLGDDSELDAAQRGIPGDALAYVADEGLAAFMGVEAGSQLDIVYNQGGWVVIEEVADGVDVLVRGDIEYDDPDTGETLLATDVPLVVAFDVGEAGRVVFTSSHNEAQITDDTRDVLRYQLSQLSR